VLRNQHRNPALIAIWWGFAFYGISTIYKETKTMATKQKASTSPTLRVKVKKKRPGVHSKKKTAKLKTSKNYKKPYQGQGR